MRHLVWVLVIFIAGCATVPRQNDSQALSRLACDPGRGVQKVSGSVWMKVKSPESSGQFPAQVEALNPGKLKMEVTNLVGGTEALIDVDGARVTIEKSDGQKSVQTGSWGGIPLKWASALFLGQIPCPDSADWSQTGDVLVGTSGSERFEYRFRKWGERLWPEALVWSKANLKVDFKFDDPDDLTASPKKWEAHSQLGQIAVRWKDRKVERGN